MYLIQNHQTIYVLSQAYYLDKMILNSTSFLLGVRIFHFLRDATLCHQRLLGHKCVAD